MIWVLVLVFMFLVMMFRLSVWVIVMQVSIIEWLTALFLRLFTKVRSILTDSMGSYCRYDSEVVLVLKSSMVRCMLRLCSLFRLVCIMVSLVIRLCLVIFSSSIVVGVFVATMVLVIDSTSVGLLMSMVGRLTAICSLVSVGWWC